MVIHALTPAAEAAGFEARDRLHPVDGEPIGWWFRSRERLATGVANTYTVQKRDGRQVSAALEPVPPDIQIFLPQRVLEFAIPLVAVIYLAIGVGVWRLKRDRPESWALLLFCGVVAAQLFLAGPNTAVGWILNLITVPFIGATAFHLFTSYPIGARVDRAASPDSGDSLRAGRSGGRVRRPRALPRRSRRDRGSHRDLLHGRPSR